MYSQTAKEQRKQDKHCPALFLHRLIGVVEVFAAMLAFFRDGEDLFPAHRAALGRFRCGNCELPTARGALDAPPGKSLIHFKMLATMRTTDLHRKDLHAFPFDENIAWRFLVFKTAAPLILDCRFSMIFRTFQSFSRALFTGAIDASSVVDRSSSRHDPRFFQCHIVH